MSAAKSSEASSSPSSSLNAEKQEPLAGEPSDSAPLRARMIRRMGAEFVPAMQADHAVAVADITRCWWRACQLCGAEALWDQVDLLAGQLPVTQPLILARAVRTLVERVTRWMLNNRQSSDEIVELVAHYTRSIHTLLDTAPQSAQLETDDPLAMFDRASRAAPRDVSLHLTLALEKSAGGDERGSQAHLLAAQMLQTDAGEASESALQALCALATQYFILGDDPNAVRWYLLALTMNPHLAEVFQNLAAIYDRNGHAEQSDYCRMRAYRIQRVFMDAPPGAVRRVLILCSGLSAGNVPLEAMWQNAKTTRIKFAIDCAQQDEEQMLPPFDLVFNAIGDADIAAPLTERLERFRARCSRPMLNAPAAVCRTRRHLMVDLLGDLKTVALAPCLRLAPPLVARVMLQGLLDKAGVGFPLLLRPEATHGGQGLERCDSLEALHSKLSAGAGAHYLTHFIDTRSADGFYRKYRMIFVDRQPYPYHLAISPQWMVHYFSADMLAHAWKLDEERRFLHDPSAVLGTAAMEAICAIGQRLALDYAGIDFTVLADGRVLVFEANATMLAHPEADDGALAHKNPYVRRIVEAFERMLLDRLEPALIS